MIILVFVNTYVVYSDILAKHNLLDSLSLALSGVILEKLRKDVVPSGGEGRTIQSNKELTELFKNTIKCLHHDFMFTNRNKMIRNIREIFSKVCKKTGG